MSCNTQDPEIPPLNEPTKKGHQGKIVDAFLCIFFLISERKKNRRYTYIHALRRFQLCLVMRNTIFDFFPLEWCPFFSDDIDQDSPFSLTHCRPHSCSLAGRQRRKRELGNKFQEWGAFMRCEWDPEEQGSPLWLACGFKSKRDYIFLAYSSFDAQIEYKYCMRDSCCLWWDLIF